ncbi:hypothetical protein H6P81_007085 [Aristolochia fimbriata]|uniref:Uncharacterized protein n=1 Tax=Aristolochia fimbriata TaxID=158543 RepID=A0AAV7F1X7_ARIFI|nr:hypothetical protein H6P81_007085 [Aristolochia fimbriata]
MTAPSLQVGQDRQVVPSPSHHAVALNRFTIDKKVRDHLLSAAFRECISIFIVAVVSHVYDSSKIHSFANDVHREWSWLAEASFVDVLP